MPSLKKGIKEATIKVASNNYVLVILCLSDIKAQINCVITQLLEFHNTSFGNTDLEITHINTIDDTVEGVECKKDKIFAVQYLPTSTNDGTDLYDKFISYMKEAKANA